MTVVVLALDSRTPWLRSFGVPVYASNLINGVSSALGYFEIEFVDADEPPLPQGRVATYVVMEGQVYGAADGRRALIGAVWRAFFRQFGRATASVTTQA